MHIAPDTIVDGRYRVLKRLGTGGMAEVWCAEDEVLGRNVALKLLGSRYAEDPEFRERFRREARAAAGLDAPQHRRHLRPRGVGRDAVHRDGAGRRAHAQGARDRARADAHRRRDRPHRAASEGARLRAQARDRAPRRQAAERDHRRRGPGQGGRLRDRPRRQLRHDRDRRDRRHRPVPVARAGARPAGRPALRPVLGGRRALRAADRPRAVRRRGAGLDRAQARVRAPGAAVAAAARASRRRSSPSSCARSRRTRRTASRAPRSSSRRWRTRAARRPARSCASPSPSRSGLALVDLAARRARGRGDRRRRVLPVRRQTRDGAERRRP